MNNEPLLTFNGIDADTGNYFIPPMTATQMREKIIPRSLPRDKVKTLDQHHKKLTKKTFGLAPDLGNPNNLANAGWGVIFPDKCSDEIRKALSPLLERRKSQATGKSKYRYREYAGEHEGYKPGTTLQEFLADHKVGADLGIVNSDEMPYYLLLVGSPEEIPFEFQYELDRYFHVGRLDLETPEEYANYAKGVIAAEDRQQQNHQAVFFGTSHDGDPATQTSSEVLIRELSLQLNSSVNGEKETWQLPVILGKDATKARLTEVFTADRVPSLLFTATHGLGMKKGHQQQRDLQGALVCQDWPGPTNWHSHAMPPDYYFSANDITDSMSVGGMICFNFACFSAGAPVIDDMFINHEPIATQPFTSRLARKLLGHPNGGALAVVGHVGAAYGASFYSVAKGQIPIVFRSALYKLLKGERLGQGIEFFNNLAVLQGVSLSDLLLQERNGKIIPSSEVVRQYTTYHDAQNFIILGDPAVRIS